MVIPTYCERDNLESIVARVLAAGDGIRVLVVDDNSPDGTGEIADRLAAGDERVDVLHRSGKDGLGAAYRAGFHRALDGDANTRPDFIVEMDADGSHQPEQLPALLAPLHDGADLVIGTRWMPGGEIRNWPARRQLLSRGGTSFARYMLRSRLRDLTSGFRAFRATSLAATDLDSLTSQGYCFQIELAWRFERAGADVREVPITFVERVEGHSKMSLAIVIEAMWSVFAWGVRDRLAGPRSRSRVPGIQNARARE